MSKPSSPESAHSRTYELRSLVTRSTQSSGVRNFFSRLPTGLKLLFHGQTDPVQFTLILRTEDLPNAQPIAWEVFEVNRRNPSFEVLSPEGRAFGHPKIEESPETGTSFVSCTHFRSASPGWTSWVKPNPDNTGVIWWVPFKYHPDSGPEYILVKNATKVPRKFAIGTSHYATDDAEFQPFLLTDNVSPWEELRTLKALFLQIYLTSNVKRGQLMTESLLQTPLLKPTEGIKVADLPLVQDKMTFKVLYGGLGGISLAFT